MAGAKIEPLTAAEKKWVEQQLTALRELSVSFGNADPGARVSAELLDEIYAAWFRTGEKKPAAINAVINAIGVGFGELLIERTGLKWVIATDGHGTDLAVHGQPGDVLVYPANLIAKRWERGETSFIARTLDALSKEIGRVAAEHEPFAKKRAWWRFW